VLPRLIFLASIAAAAGCGAGQRPDLAFQDPDRARSDGRSPALTVAGDAPEAQVALGPFDCAQGVDVRAAGRRYCMYNQLSSWPDAEARCVAHGGHLATIPGPDVTATLFQALGARPGPSGFWIGLAEPAEGRWLWASGAPVSFSAWNPGEPNNSGGNENCGEWLLTGARWNDIDCATRRGFLCETKVGNGKSGLACAHQLTAFGSAFCLVQSSPSTWEEAQHLCTAAGGNLAVLDSEAKNQALATALGASPTQATVSLWIGLNDRVREGDFRWIDGEPVTHTAWRGGEPNNQGDEDCAEWSPSDGRWNDLPCATQIGSLCQAP
jgi:hypothetical protein